MTKNELRDKIKTLAKQILLPKSVDLDKGNDVSLNALKFPVLGKFPELKKVIVDLLTQQYEIFLTDIQWVAPRPTTFRIVLANKETFYLTYTERSWIAKVEGKKYYLLNISEEQNCVESIARILAYGTKIIADVPTEAPVPETSPDSPAPESPAPETPTPEKIPTT